jgi:hypothetical protein
MMVPFVKMAAKREVKQISVAIIPCQMKPKISAQYGFQYTSLKSLKRALLRGRVDESSVAA